ncbi:MAG TPA: iron ABC transporter permease, partial [Vicinamibacterales bacterium]|nr:iron ABC transporter permease [Vicinamibacterales bacterium]
MLLQDRPVVTTPPAVSASALQPVTPAPPKIEVAGMNFYYGARRVLESITVNVQPHQVTALIGPSGCGKST